MVNSIRRLTIAASATLIAVNAMAWGQKGHDVTAAVAERHLTPAAAAVVNDLLDGKSMIYWSNWLDNASHTPEYAYTKTWHFKNIEKGERYEEAQANPAGDIATAIKAQIEVLDGTVEAARADSVLALKILIHLMGDLHQPMHLGRAQDLGGNRIKVKYFGRNQNLHSVWDSALPESAHNWSYTEWVDQIDRLSPSGQATVTSGSIDDWAKGTMLYATQVYESVEPVIERGEEPKMSYDEVALWTPVIEEQLLKGGLRLAKVLNSVFEGRSD